MPRAPRLRCARCLRLPSACLQSTFPAPLQRSADTDMPSFSFGKSPKVHARTASSANLSRSGEKRSFSIPANIILLVIIALILCCGLITLYAVTRTETEYSITRQLVGVAIGIVIMVAVWFFDYRRLANLIVPLIVLDAILILLPMVPGLGHEVNGATSWIRIGSRPSPFRDPSVNNLTVTACLPRSSLYGTKVKL